MASFDILNYLKIVQSISKVGLSYATDPYDLERYTNLKELTNEALATITHQPLSSMTTIFEAMDDYPTPKVDVRGLIISDGKVLLIQEKIDDKWSLPGGWCDVGYSPRENIEKEVWEEAGIKVKASRLLAVWDKKHHEHPADIHYVYKLCFRCEIISGHPDPGHEATNAGYFDIANLPELSLPRNTESQIKKLYELAHQAGETIFD